MRKKLNKMLGRINMILSPLGSFEDYLSHLLVKSKRIE